MHAAHERVNYNSIREGYARKELVAQPLLIPQVLTLPYEQVNNLTEQMELIRTLGFDLEAVEPQKIEVRAVPSILSHVNCGSLVRDLAAEPISEGWQERVEERIDHIAARIACHASVRSGDVLNRQEAYALFDQLDRVAVSGACPHGRPVVARFSREAVERWFGRDR
jgi:DNA mismatch repair protein MutL